MAAEGFVDEAQALREATTHWLRHTGASKDIATRPLKHMADDLGHASMGTTDQVYIQSDMKDRARSGKQREVWFKYIKQLFKSYIKGNLLKKPRDASHSSLGV